MSVRSYQNLARYPKSTVDSRRSTAFELRIRIVRTVDCQLSTVD